MKIRRCSTRRLSPQELLNVGTLHQAQHLLEASRTLSGLRACAIWRTEELSTGTSASAHPPTSITLFGGTCALRPAHGGGIEKQRQGGWVMAEKKAGTCAHPGCECPVAKGSKYCSPY